MLPVWRGYRSGVVLYPYIFFPSVQNRIGNRYENGERFTPIPLLSGTWHRHVFFHIAIFMSPVSQKNISGKCGGCRRFICFCVL